MFASNTAAWSVGRRGEPPRNRITDGRLRPEGKQGAKVRVRRDEHALFVRRACEDFVVCGGLKTILADMHGVMPRGA